MNNMNNKGTKIYKDASDVLDCIEYKSIEWKSARRLHDDMEKKRLARGVEKPKGYKPKIMKALDTKIRQKYLISDIEGFPVELVKDKTTLSKRIGMSLKKKDFVHYTEGKTSFIKLKDGTEIIIEGMPLAINSLEDAMEYLGLK